MECKIKYLSPTSLNTFETATDAFVLNYVIGVPRTPQLRVMAVGSAFDAYVKGALCNDPELTKTLLDKQVEPQWRIEVPAYGHSLFERYQKCGAYDRLRKEIGDSPIQCEFDAKAVIDGVPIAGKPDLHFVKQTPEGSIGAIFDWKVNGFLSKASPCQGYSHLLHTTGEDRGAHKNCIVMCKYGFDLAIGAQIKKDWNDQIHMYAWSLAKPEIASWVLGIDQLVLTNLLGKYTKLADQSMRVAIFRFAATEREDLRARLKRAWDQIKAEHYYADRTKEESDARVDMLAKCDDSLRWAILGK